MFLRELTQILRSSSDIASCALALESQSTQVPVRMSPELAMGVVQQLMVATYTADIRLPRVEVRPEDSELMWCAENS